METKVSPYDLPPIENARRQYVELFGSALVMNTYLKIALLCVSIVALGLLVLNFRTVKKYEHLKPLEMMANAAKQGQPLGPDQLISFKMVLPHVQQHMEYLASDETKAEIYKQLNARMAAVLAIAQGIEARMARATRNGAAPQEIMTQLQAPRQ